MSEAANSLSKDQRLRLFILLGWAVFALVQSACIDLLNDEAYYWHYSRHLDWGYFHQPPMIALLIRVGTLLLPGEMGVRLMVVLMSVGTLFLLERMTAKKDVRLFFAVALSLGFVHAGSLIAAPDIPLLFFSALFLYLLRDFLQQDSWQRGLLLGVVAACILYSKYHGIFLLGLTLVANPRLLMRYTTWAALLLAASLFLPHLLWHYQHDFPAYNYHYVERMEVDWDFSYPLFYLSGILVIGLPLFGPVLLWAAIQRRTTDRFERTLKFFLVGTLICFFMLSFRGRMEANWIVSILLPAIVLGHQQILSWSQRARKWVFVIAGCSIGLLMVVRVYAMMDFLPAPLAVTQTLHRGAAWNGQLAELAGDRTVIFLNEYRLASKYEFYTGKKAFSFNALDHAGNQYDLWPDELEAQGQRVMMMTGYWLWRGDSIMDVYGKKLYYEYRDSFQSYQPYTLTLNAENLVFQKGTEAHLQVSLNGPGPLLHIPTQYPTTLWYVLRRRGKPALQGELMIANPLFEHVPSTFEIRLPMPADPGNYVLMLGFSNYALPPQRNSKLYEVRVVD